MLVDIGKKYMTNPQVFEIAGKYFAAIPLEVYKNLVEDSEMLADILPMKLLKI